MRRRLLAGVVGVAALGVALGTDVSLPLSPVLSMGSDYLLVAAVGVVGLLLAMALLVSGRAANLNQGETPTPERRATAPPAGRDIDERRRSARLLVPVFGASARRELRERLRRAAVGVLSRTDAETQADARARIERGEWGGDAVATAFLAEDERLPPAAFVGAVRHAEQPYSYATRRTASELRALEEGST